MYDYRTVKDTLSLRVTCCSTFNIPFYGYYVTTKKIVFGTGTICICATFSNCVSHGDLIPTRRKREKEIEISKIQNLQQ